MQRISVITINRNNSVGLEKTILSVINQNYDNYEYIVIDGKSEDSSIEIIKKYSEQIDYWISEKDNGIYNAMNKGIKVATGEYIIFMNSGDFFYSDKILYNLFEGNKREDFLIGAAIGYGKRASYVIPYFEMITAYNLLMETFPHQATFTKSSVFNEIGLYDETLKICADWKFLVIGALIYNKTILTIDQCISVVEYGGISARDDFMDLFRNERESVLKEYFHYYYSDYKQLKKYKKFSKKRIRAHAIWRLRHFLFG